MRRPSRQQRKTRVATHEKLCKLRDEIGDDAAFYSVAGAMVCTKAAASGLSFDALCEGLRPLYDDAAKGFTAFREERAKAKM